MKARFIIVFFFFSIQFLAQNPTRGTISVKRAPQDTTPLPKQPDQEDDVFHNTGLMYESKYYLYDLQGQFKTFRDFSLRLPTNYISILLFGQGVFGLRGRTHSSPAYLKYSYVIPTYIYLNDTVRESLRGYTLQFGVIGYSMVESKFLDVSLIGGANIGRLKIMNEQRQKLKNGSLGPCASLITRGKFGNLRLYFMAGFDYDVSFKQWKKLWFRTKQNEILPFFNQSGVTCSLGVSYVLKT